MSIIKQVLEEDGFYFAKGLLSSGSVLEAYKKAFIELVDALGQHYLQKTEYVLQQAIKNYSFFERFAIYMGLSSGIIFDHLSPALTIQFDDFVWQSEWPSAQLPEMFALIRNHNILDLLEEVMGSEISSSSQLQINIKLSKHQLKLMHQVAAEIDRPLLTGWRYQFRFGKTPWHRDATAALRDSRSSQIYTVWIPLTTATEENACLQFLPGSHRLDCDTLPSMPDLEQKVKTVPAEVGDVLVFDNNTHHCSLENISEYECRWAVNFRYLPTGQASGRPFLPGFIARSRLYPEQELRCSKQWERMWRQAFKYHDKHGVPLSLYRTQEMNQAEAEAFTQHWKSLASDHASWLCLA